MPANILRLDYCPPYNLPEPYFKKAIDPEHPDFRPFAIRERYAGYDD